MPASKKRNFPLTGSDVLKSRIEALRAELAGVADELAELERNRRADMAGCQADLDDARQKAANAAVVQQRAFIAADAVKAAGQRGVDAGRALLRQAEEQYAAAAEMDLLTGIGGPVRRAQAALREREEHWKAELARIQNGEIRRKRSQLEAALAKLERRVQRKSSEPAPAEGTVSVLPAGRGTGKLAEPSAK